MSQLMLGLARSHGRLLRAPAGSIGPHHHRLLPRSVYPRQLTQRASVQNLQLAEKPSPSVDYDRQSYLFSVANSNILPMQDFREDTATIHYLQTGKTLLEQLSVMQMCLENGNVEQAQRILVGMYRLYPQAMRDVADVNVHNEILGGMLKTRPQPLTTPALQWFDMMEAQYGVKPNANTFAILIGGFVNAGMNSVALVLMPEMLRSGFTIHEMLLSRYLTDEDIQRIKAMAQAIMSEGVEDCETASMVLEEVKKAEASLQGISTDFVNSIKEQSEHEHLESPGSDELKKTSVDPHLQEELKSTNVTGIVQLKETLKTLRNNDLEGYNLQVRLENNTYDGALKRYQEINKKRGDPLLSADMGRLKPLAASWLPRLEALIEEEQQRCQVGSKNYDRSRGQYGDFFRKLDASKMAVITILETLRISALTSKPSKTEESLALHNESASGTLTAKLATLVSQAIHNEMRLEQMKKRTNRHVVGYNLSVARLATSGKLFNMAIRRAKAREHRELGDTMFLDAWDISTKMRIGSLLISMLIEAARVPETSMDSTGQVVRHMVPAFTHSCTTRKGKRYGMVTPHKSLMELFRSESIAGFMHARHLPMLVPPRPWLAYNSGGYLTRDEPCMRMQENHEQLRYLKRASNEDRLTTLLTGLDALGMTRWAINHTVFAAVKRAWNSGHAVAEIPASVYNAPEPQKPEDFETSKQAKFKYYAEMREWRNAHANQHSQRCDCNYKIEIAQAFLNHTMFFPHNIDFRGRAYPIPPHFNHLGNDMCRGLLVFHEGRPLTERGIYWLKIHLANLCGKDKLSHEERLRFVDENWDNIAASADNPLPDTFFDGTANVVRPWWLDAENPWQALAACVEYTAAMRSPDPAAYVSHLHIHQDGTCNGLQHYAAMGRDRVGAYEVNLAPSDCPQDVYSGVLAVAKRLVDADAENGVKEAQLLQSHLSRKIVKQTVMTNVYGVTLIGAKEQIAARLREVKDEKGEHVFDILVLQSLAMYLAKKIFASLGEMFMQAQEIQNWLNQSARRIARSMPASALAAWKKMTLESTKSRKQLSEVQRDARDSEKDVKSDTVLELRPDLGPGALRYKRLEELATKPMSTVVWTTPLGLTVVQPYRKTAFRNVPTNLQHIYINDVNMPTPVNSQKQSTAFPPNFVHSLDASHMVLSAIECKAAGLVFSSVHDSYWTHACDIDRMNGILRSQFVKLHQTPIMETLKQEFEQRYANHKMPVANWEYNADTSFSKGGVLSQRRRSVCKSKAQLKLDKEKLIEEDLARCHFEVHDSLEKANTAKDDAGLEKTSAADSDAKAAAASIAAKLADSMELVDLSSIEIIDTKKDLFGALRQTDLIAYTLKVNQAKLIAEISAVKKNYSSQVRAARKAAKEVAKAAAKAAENPKKTRSRASKKPVSDITPENVDEHIEKLLSARDSEIDALVTKYPVTFETPKILISPVHNAEAYKSVEELISNGTLAGRLVKRFVWEDIKFDDLPTQGEFDINEVLKSPYFFS
ncbi:DNA-directed RNA polymerase [Coemansia sp. RSA 1365]|nr:DNA-directed RNA polymerase [Coemansia sp. RSA 1365]